MPPRNQDDMIAMIFGLNKKLEELKGHVLTDSQKTSLCSWIYAFIHEIWEYTKHETYSSDAVYRQTRLRLFSHHLTRVSAEIGNRNFLIRLLLRCVWKLSCKTEIESRSRKPLGWFGKLKSGRFATSAAGSPLFSAICTVLAVGTCESAYHERYVTIVGRLTQLIKMFRLEHMENPKEPKFEGMGKDPRGELAALISCIVRFCIPKKQRSVVHHVPESHVIWKLYSELGALMSDCEKHKDLDDHEDDFTSRLQPSQLIDRLCVLAKYARYRLLFICEPVYNLLPTIALMPYAKWITGELGHIMSKRRIEQQHGGAAATAVPNPQGFVAQLPAPQFASLVLALCDLHDGNDGGMDFTTNTQMAAAFPDDTSLDAPLYMDVPLDMADLPDNITLNAPFNMAVEPEL